MGTSFSRIVVPLDGGPEAERAIPVASALAVQAGVPMTFVRVIPDGDPGYDARAYLRARRSGLTAVTDQEVLRGLPAAHALADYLDLHRRALVCCTTHARSALGELILGSVAEELMRRTDVPMLLVGPRVVLPSPVDRYRELVVCIGDDPAGPRVLPFVRELCLALNLQPWLLQVVEPSPADRSAESMSTDQADPLEGISQAFTALGVDVGRHIAHGGNVPETISAFAATLTDPIVAVASRRRSLGDQLREASVAVGVARTATCPLLVVGPDCESDDEVSGGVHTTA